jgi:ATP-binding cassette, subfamily B, bacterial
MSLVQTSWMFLKPYRWRMLVVLLGIVVVTAAGLLTPWLIRALVQAVRTGGDPAAALQGVTLIVAALLAAYALRSIGQFLTNHMSHVVAWNLCHDLRVALYRQLQRLSPAYYASRQSGEIVSRVIKDTDNIEPLIADIVYEFVVSALLMIGTTAVLLLLDARLALIALIPLPFLIAIQLKLHRPIFAAFGRELEKLGSLSALVQDNIAGMKEIQIFNRERQEFGRVSGLSHHYAQDQIYARKLIAMLQPLVAGATGLSIVLVVWFGGRSVVQGRLAVEDLVAFVLYLITFYQPVQMLIDVSEGLQLGLASARRIHEVLRIQPDVEDPQNGIDPGRVRGKIRFDHVTFAYAPGTQVLRDISCAGAGWPDRRR